MRRKFADDEIVEIRRNGQRAVVNAYLPDDGHYEVVYTDYEGIERLEYLSASQLKKESK